jgi:CubicO group peptidase (beta-lactamase class C family)
MAVGYHYTGEGYIPAPPWHTSWASGAGALYGTVEDLLAWSVALLSGKVMTESSLKTMFAPIPASRGTYGLGWYLRGHLGRRRVYHGGYIFGFRGDLSLYPDDGATIIVLSNVDQAKTRRMAEDLAAILFGLPREAPRRRETKAADPDLYVSLEGEYDTSEVFGEGSIMRVRADGGHVGYRANTIYDSLGLPMYIYPSPDGSFFDRTSATRYRFVMGNDGKAEALIIDDEEEIHSYPRTGP